MNGACLFAYEVHQIVPTKNELEDPKSLPDIQRSMLNGKCLIIFINRITIKLNLFGEVR